MIFTATIDKIVKEEQGYRLFLSQVESVENSVFNNGVILNTTFEQGNEIVKEAKEGALLQVKLKEPAIMTMSLPPQIPGKVIEELTLIEK